VRLGDWLGENILSSILGPNLKDKQEGFKIPATGLAAIFVNLLVRPEKYYHGKETLY
jgi:hypothetical protein